MVSHTRLAGLPGTDLRIRAGVDLLPVRDVEDSISRFGDQYLGRVFTEHELACCTGSPATSASGLAARFAAKEAMLKVLGPGDGAVDWRSIEVRRGPVGDPRIRLSGAARELADDARIVDVAVSLSHEAGLATAVVVALCLDDSEGVS